MKNEITYDDYANLDIRAGLIIEADAPEWSEKLIRYVVFLGEEIGNRVLFSGIRAWYTPADLTNKLIPVLINMKPKKMGNEYSQGMALMVDGDERPEMIFLSDNIKPGTVIR